MKRITYSIAILLITSIAVFNSCKKTETTTPAAAAAQSAPVMAWDNSPVGAGLQAGVHDTLKFHAVAVAGATYNWTGPGGLRLSGQNPTDTFNLSMTGAWTLTTTVGGITSAPFIVYVTNMQITAFSDSVIPAASGGGVVNNLPTFTTGNALGLNATTVYDIKNQVIPMAYSWTGPNGYTSKLQNPSIANFSYAAAGTYSVSASYTDSTKLQKTHTSNVATFTVGYRPAAPKLVSNTPTVGGTLNLTATIAAGANPNADTMFYWTGPNNFTSRKQNPTIANVGRSAIGTYSCYTVNKANNAIMSLTGSVAVNVNFSQSTNCGNQLYVIFGGVVYNLVTIGNQCWMQQDLQNGASSTLFTWAQATPSGIAPQQGACPVGFHVPNDSMFQKLAGFASYDGNELKTVAAGGHKVLGFAATLASDSAYWSYTTNGSGSNADYLFLSGSHVMPNDSIIGYGSVSQKTQMLVRCMKD